MRIDAHQHFWRYDAAAYPWISGAMTALRRDRLPADLAGELHSNGFDGCVAVQARQEEAETDDLLAFSRDYAFVKGVVGWVDLQADGLADRLAYYAQFPAIKGFRHIVQDEPDDRFLVRDRFVAGVKQLATYGFSYDILVYEKHLPVVAEFLEHFDEGHAFVLDHIGKPRVTEGVTNIWREGIRAVAAHPNVFCKLSGLVTEADWTSWNEQDFFSFLEIVFDAFGTDRLMVGSDWPVCLLAAQSYEEVIHIVEKFMTGFSREDKEKVFGTNAARFYNL